MRKWLMVRIFFVGMLMMAAVFYAGCASREPTGDRKMGTGKAPLEAEILVDAEKKIRQSAPER